MTLHMGDDNAKTFAADLWKILLTKLYGKY